MNLLFLLFPLNLISPTTDSGSVKIHVEIENQDSNIIDIKPPIDRSVYYDTLVFKHFKNIKGGKSFDILLPLNYSTFIRLEINHEQNISFAVAPKDNISIKLKRIKHDNYISYDFKIHGSNAIAHEIYNNRFIPPGKFFNFFDNLFRQPFMTYSDFYTKSKIYIDSITQIWDSLKINNLISSDVYDLYKGDTKACLYNEAIIKLPRISMDTSWTNYVKWLNIRNLMFFQGDAANKMLLKTDFGIHLYQKYLLNILREDDYVKDTLIKTTNLGYFYYYDTSYREREWGEYLWELEKQFPLPWTSKTDMNELITFKSYYPNSVYLKKIEGTYDSVLNERKQLQEPITINENKIETIIDIFNPIDGRFFFIDFWATWCQPCIRELNYYTAEFYKFLKINNIKNIFLSVDKIEDKEKWKTLIKEHYIRGTHYIISDEIQKEFLKILSKDENQVSFMIPQYLLYDKAKDKYYIGLPRPSTKEALELFIQNIIDKN